MLEFELVWHREAEAQFDALIRDRARSKRAKAVQKCLRLLRTDPRHPGLNTHEWKGYKCPHGEKLFEAYAENNTPGAYRVFFCYVPNDKRKILIVAVTPHP